VDIPGFPFFSKYFQADNNPSYHPEAPVEKLVVFKLDEKNI
jgi:hypothetical protein